MKKINMKLKSLVLIILILMTSISLTVSASPPDNFNQAKNIVREIYNDNPITFYCGCEIDWNKRTGTSGKINHNQCGYEIRSSQSKNAVSRANRVEVEHVVPISWISDQFQCGNRSECRESSPAYNRAEADLHNLVPAIGEVNMDRSNYRFGMVQNIENQYGRCDVKVDFKNRVVEPPNSVKGQIARIHFYKADFYGFKMSRSQEQLMLAWHNMYPVSNWEVERDLRIKKYVGYSNPFVTGEKEWHLGFKPSLKGLNMLNIENRVETNIYSEVTVENPEVKVNGSILGTSSKIYHLPVGCPSYNRINVNNATVFNTEAEAIRAGYRKAQNCN